ncbi:MAG: molybdopterin molybdotransferase MoeA [Thermoplasmataceae archaeon]
MRSIYRNLVTFRKAIELVEANMPPVMETETVSIDDALGRIVSEDIFCPMNTPPFNRATMDGYAVRSTDIAGCSPDKPVTLVISGESFIGTEPPALTEAGKCIRISTGSIVPPGADSIVPVESTSEIAGNVIITQATSRGENIAEAGSDMAEGSLVLGKGREIQPHDVAVLASMGISKVRVFRRIRVSVISTGNELIGAGEPYSPGKIYEANSHMVLSDLSTMKFMETRFLGLVPDRMDEIERTVLSGLEHSDIVLLSGGSSAGESDLVYAMAEKLVPGIIFHGVLAKPGLPTVFARSGEKIIIGLPGFPVSAAMILRTIFLPGIAEMAGMTGERITIHGVLGKRVTLEIGKQNLIPSRMLHGNPSRIYPVQGLSGSISRFSGTSGYISLPGTTKFMEAGDPVDFHPWSQGCSLPAAGITGTVERQNARIIREFLPGTAMAYSSPEEAVEMILNMDVDAIVLKSVVDSETGSAIGGIPANLTESVRIYELGRRSIWARGSPEIASADKLEGYIEKCSSIVGPSLKYLENIIGKNATEKRIVAAIRRNVPVYGQNLTSGNQLVLVEGDPEEVDGITVMTYADLLLVRTGASHIIHKMDARFRSEKSGRR